MTNHPRLVIGIDGGGSKTEACLARVDVASDPRTPKVLGRTSSGPCNPQTVGFQTTFSVLDSTISTLFADARLERRPVAAACLALAGTGRVSESQRVRDWAETAGIADKLAIVHDAEPLLAAGTPEGVGVTLVAGTGSFAYGRGPDGQTQRAGGYGYLFGDEGGGYWIARQALVQITRAWDGRGPTTQLTDVICRQLDVSQPEALVPRILQDYSSPSQLACLAEAVLECAQAGDDVAEAVVQQAGRELAELVLTVVRQLDMPRPTIPLALAGSLLIHAPTLKQALIQRLESAGPTFKPISTVEHPVLGALQLALQILEERLP